MFPIMQVIHLGESKKSTLDVPRASWHLLHPMSHHCKITICVGSLPGIACKTDFSRNSGVLRQFFRTLDHWTITKHTFKWSWRLFISILNIDIICSHVIFWFGILMLLVAQAAILIILWKAGCSRAWMGYSFWLIMISETYMAEWNVPDQFGWTIQLLPHERSHQSTSILAQLLEFLGGVLQLNLGWRAILQAVAFVVR